MSQEEIKINQTQSSQSFEILDSPQTEKTVSSESYDVFPNIKNTNDNDDDLPPLDDEYVQVPTNSPHLSCIQIDGYDLKKEQIKKLIKMIKLKGSSIKERREIKSLEKHLDKLVEYEKKQIDFNLVNKMMKTFAKTDNKMNNVLKNLYIDRTS